MLSFDLAPDRVALLLLTAARNVGTLRELGDVYGHDFHGNQWTTGSGERWRKGDAEEGRVLNGVPLSTVDHPDFSQSINHTIVEPPLVVPKGKHVSAGIVVTEPDGSMWVVEPHNRYGGYRSTFPKGTVDKGENLQQTAAREVWEESGLVAKVTGHLTDVERTTSVARFYTGVRVGGAPWAAGKETHAVKLIPIHGKGTEHTLKSVFGKPTSDHKVLDALRMKHRALGDVTGHEFHGNQWTAGADGHPLGYEWKPKAGSSSGLYAYHKNGVQVSKGFAKEDAHKAVATINNGKGPDVVAAPAAATPPATTGYPAGLTKIGEAKGSNPGGLHEDASGQKYYVKQYGKPEQAASEHVANAIYSAVGAKVPETSLGPKGELASKWLPDAGKTLGTTGLTKDNANAILDHYAADVFVANWDAVGTGHDNILVGKNNSVTRVDQGGTLLYRAQGGLKPEGGLGKIGEWQTLADKGMNPYYAKVFQAAGVKHPDDLGARAVKQIDKITAARPAAGWKSFVEKVAPHAGAAFHTKVGAMLESRQKGLEEKRAELTHKLKTAGDVEGHDFHGNQWTSGRGGEHPPGYEWKPKAGSVSGLWAYHKNGVQVSKGFAKGDAVKAVATINNGKGPETKVAVPALVAPQTVKPSSLAELHAHTDAALAAMKNGTAPKDAILGLHEDAAVRTELITKLGGNARAQKEYATTPIVDLKVLTSITVENTPVHGQAFCTSARGVTMGSTSAMGDFRHELGHAVLFGSSPAMQAWNEARHKEAQARVAANPAGLQKKLDHAFYEKTYGVIGRRALDNAHENFAEHYRGYHKAVYQTRSGEDAKALSRYSDLHPKWAAMWDARYSTAGAK